MLGAAVVLALGHPLWPRFFFFAFGFGALVVVRGGLIGGVVISKVVQRLGAKLHPERAGLVFCSCLILISAMSIPYAYLPKQDFEGARSYVNDSRKPGDSVVTVGRIALPYSTYYETDFVEVNSVQKLEEVRARANRTWLLYMIPADVQFVYPQLMENIQQNFRVVKTFPSPLADGVIFVCVDES